MEKENNQDQEALYAFLFDICTNVVSNIYALGVFYTSANN